MEKAAKKKVRKPSKSPKPQPSPSSSTRGSRSKASTRRKQTLDSPISESSSRGGSTAQLASSSSSSKATSTDNADSTQQLVKKTAEMWLNPPASSSTSSRMAWKRAGRIGISEIGPSQIPVPIIVKPTRSKTAELGNPTQPLLFKSSVSIESTSLESIPSEHSKPKQPANLLVPPKVQIIRSKKTALHDLNRTQFPKLSASIGSISSDSTESVHIERKRRANLALLSKAGSSSSQSADTDDQMVTSSEGLSSVGVVSEGTQCTGIDSISSEDTRISGAKKSKEVKKGDAAPSKDDKCDSTTQKVFPRLHLFSDSKGTSTESEVDLPTPIESTMRCFPWEIPYFCYTRNRSLRWLLSVFDDEEFHSYNESPEILRHFAEWKDYDLRLRRRISEAEKKLFAKSDLAKYGLTENQTMAIFEKFLPLPLLISMTETVNKNLAKWKSQHDSEDLKPISKLTIMEFVGIQLYVDLRLRQVILKNIKVEGDFLKKCVERVGLLTIEKFKYIRQALVDEDRDPMQQISDFYKNFTNKYGSKIENCKFFGLQSSKIPFKSCYDEKIYKKEVYKGSGLEIFRLCDAETGYILRHYLRSEKPPTFHENITTNEIALKVMKKGLDKHNVFISNQYTTTLWLAKELKDRNTFIVGQYHNKLCGAPNMSNARETMSQPRAAAKKSQNVIALKTVSHDHVERRFLTTRTDIRWYSTHRQDEKGRHIFVTNIEREYDLSDLMTEEFVVWGEEYLANQLETVVDKNFTWSHRAVLRLIQYDILKNMSILYNASIPPYARVSVDEFAAHVISQLCHRSYFARSLQPDVNKEPTDETAYVKTDEFFAYKRTPDDEQSSSSDDFFFLRTF